MEKEYIALMRGHISRMSAEWYYEELGIHKEKINEDVYDEIGYQLFNNENDYLVDQTNIYNLMCGIKSVFEYYDLKLTDIKLWDDIYCESVLNARLYSFEYAIIKLLGFEFYKKFINRFIKNHPEMSESVISINKRLNDLYHFIEI